MQSPTTTLPRRPPPGLEHIVPAALANRVNDEADDAVVLARVYAVLVTSKLARDRFSTPTQLTIVYNRQRQVLSNAAINAYEYRLVTSCEMFHLLARANSRRFEHRIDRRGPVYRIRPIFS